MAHYLSFNDEDFSEKNMTRGLIKLIVLLSVIALSTLLIMVIWNKVIIKKFPLSDIQKLNFWEALALSVFFGLIRV
jgi:hypothetical protein